MRLAERLRARDRICPGDLSAHLSSKGDVLVGSPPAATAQSPGHDSARARCPSRAPQRRSRPRAVTAAPALRNRRITPPAAQAPAPVAHAGANARTARRHPGPGLQQAALTPPSALAPARPHPARQSECARRRPHGRDRHHRRPGFRLRAFQEPRLPAHRRSGADLRRRALAEQHAGGAAPRSRSIAPRRSSSRSASTPPTSPASSSRSPRPAIRSAAIPGRIRICRRRPTREGQGRDREGHQRRTLGCRRPDRAVLPLPGPASSAGTRHLSRRAQCRASSRPTSTRSTSRCASPSRCARR